MSINSDFKIEDGVLIKYRGTENDVSIPEGVTDIGWGAFEYCSDLTIHAHSGSYAEEYAKENNIPFKSSDQ